MRSATRVLALTAIGAAAFVPAAHAQDMSTYSFAGTTLYIGGGFQYLTLPDIKFTGQGNVNNSGEITDFHHQKNSDFNEYGGAAGAGIETALGSGAAIASPAASRASGPMSTTTTARPAAGLTASSSIRAARLSP